MDETRCGQLGYVGVNQRRRSEIGRVLVDEGGVAESRRPSRSCEVGRVVRSYLNGCSCKGQRWVIERAEWERA